MQTQLRIARPVRDVHRSRDMYCQGLGFRVLGSFSDHQGFDGVMLGLPGLSYHFEFTFCHFHPVAPTPTLEDLVVFYLPDSEQWSQRCEQVLAAGFTSRQAFNPYWDEHGRTFEDPDGYRVVVHNADWRNDELTGVTTTRS